MGKSGAKTKTLRFTQVHIENWCNFRRVEVDLQRRAFLVGPNASGKSNFLDVFRFLRDIASIGGGLQEAVLKRQGVSSLRSLAARRYPDITVQVRIGNEDKERAWEYELCFNQDNLRRAIIKKERVAREGKDIFIRPDDKDKKDEERLTQTYLEQKYANQPFRDVANFFGSVRYLHIVPQLVREPDRSVGKANDPFGGDFLEQVARTQRPTQSARLRRIVKALRVAVPQLNELELHRDARGTPHLRGKYEHWRPQGKWQNEERFSDGTLRLMGLLWAILDGSGPLLLEEPELSLNPDVVRVIPQMFARVQRRSGRQVLLSTHSTDLLQDRAVGIDEVLLLQPTAEGTRVRVASAFAEIRHLLEGGLSLGEAVMPYATPTDVHQLTLFGD